MLEFQDGPLIPETSAQRLFRQAFVHPRQQRGVGAMGRRRDERRKSSR
jgi:hypothetical protein